MGAKNRCSEPRRLCLSRYRRRDVTTCRGLDDDNLNDADNVNANGDMIDDSIEVEDDHSDDNPAMTTQR